jgi:hypothetical protein
MLTMAGRDELAHKTEAQAQEIINWLDVNDIKPGAGADYVHEHTTDMSTMTIHEGYTDAVLVECTEFATCGFNAQAFIQSGMTVDWQWDKAELESDDE